MKGLNIVFLSMTGFGSKTITIPVNKKSKIILSIELKSINSRFFETTCKLPSVLSSLEVNIIRFLKEKLMRGRIFLNVKIVDSGEILEKVSPSIALIEEYLKSINSIKSKFKISDNLTISDLINLPNIFTVKNLELSKSVEDLILKAIKSVAELLIKSRAQEGEALKKDLDKSVSICGQEIDKIKKLFKNFINKKKEEVKDTLLFYEKNENEQTKLKLDELYSILNKIDINEEIVRFNSHLQNIKKVFKDVKVEKGKRLDFTLQELLRESNTILAKCSNSEISTHAVNIKVELEKIREQIQNIV